MSFLGLSPSSPSSWGTPPLRNLFPSSFSPDILQSQGCPGQSGQSHKASVNNLRRGKCGNREALQFCLGQWSWVLNSSPLPSSGDNSLSLGTILHFHVGLSDLAKQKRLGIRDLNKVIKL